MTHPRLSRTSSSILAGLIMLACDGSTGPSVRSVEALAGTWEETLLVYQVTVPSTQTIDLRTTLPACPSSGLCLIRPYFLMLRADTTYNFATIASADTFYVGPIAGYTIVGDSLHLEQAAYSSSLFATASRLVLRTDIKVDSSLAVRLGFRWPSGADSLAIHVTQRFDRR